MPIAIKAHLVQPPKTEHENQAYWDAWLGSILWIELRLGSWE